MRTKGTAAVALVILALAGLGSTAWAEKGDKLVRFGVLYSNPTSDLKESGQTTELDSAAGLQAGFEYGITDRIGIEPAIGYVGHDITVKEQGFPDVKLETDLFALTVNANFHLMREREFDLYVGPTVGFGMWSDVKSSAFLQDFSTDDEFLYGVNFGVDWPLGERWGFSAALSYWLLDLKLEGSSSDIGVDPLQLKAGASYRF